MITKIVVDASIWIDHFRRSNEKLLTLLNDHRVLTHELLVGELLCGSVPAPRSSTLALLSNLLQIEPVEFDEVLEIVETGRIYGSGCGLIDIAVLIATLRTPETKLWSKDKKMQRLALQLGIRLVDDDSNVHSNRLLATELTAACPTA
jgi:predicted nucleic acid-binding protein